MSQFSIIGIILLVVISAAGLVLKLFLMKYRNEIDGFHGFVEKEDEEYDESLTDDWKAL